MGETNVYLPFQFRLTSIERTALINFKKDPDKEYKSFEFNAVKQRSKEEYGYQILAWRRDGYKDLYVQKNMDIHENDQLLTVGGKGLKGTYQVDFEEAYFEIVENDLKIGFIFKDKNDRRVVFHLTEDLDEDSQTLSWLPSVGHSIEKPKSLPLFFLYKFDFVRKKGTTVYLSVDDTEHIIDTYAFPKDFKSRINIQYSMESVILDFNESRKAVMDQAPIDENGYARNGEKLYHYEKAGEGLYHLESIKVEHPEHPVVTKFSPALPSYKELEEAKPLFGEFTIYPNNELGTVTGQYNVIKQQGKAIISLSFKEGWKPKSSAGYNHLINNLSTNDIVTWYKSYQCKEIVDLETFETEVEWIRTNPDRRR